MKIKASKILDIYYKGMLIIATIVQILFSDGRYLEPIRPLLPAFFANQSNRTLHCALLLTWAFLHTLIYKLLSKHLAKKESLSEPESKE